MYFKRRRMQSSCTSAWRSNQAAAIGFSFVACYRKSFIWLVVLFTLWCLRWLLSFFLLFKKKKNTSQTLTFFMYRHNSQLLMSCLTLHLICVATVTLQNNHSKIIYTAALLTLALTPLIAPQQHPPCPWGGLLILSFYFSPLCSALVLRSLVIPDPLSLTPEPTIC